MLTLTNDTNNSNLFVKLVFLFLSLTIHLFIANLFTNINSIIKPYDTSSESQHEIKINLQPEKDDEEIIPVSQPISKIVSPSDIDSSDKIPETSKLSDKTTNVPVEQIKRGDGSSKKQEVPDKNEIKEQSNKKSTNKKTKTLNSLFLDPEDSSLLALKNNRSSDVNSESENTNKEQPSSLIKDFINTPGNPDYLPNVRDGELTMLNAKADRFAVFVRRVAIQVFSAIRTSNWDDPSLFGNNVNTDDVTIVATLDSNGKFISANIVNSSKHKSFDNFVLTAVKKGAWDQNPPKEALTQDNKIRFIFKSKAWVKRQGQMGMRKWIILGTGLE